MSASAGPDAAALTRELRAAGCVFAGEEAALLLAHTRDPGFLAELLRRRVAGEPLETLLGWAGFAGLRVAVDPGVFVPRRRSELLVRVGAAAVRAVREAEPARDPVVVDLCCGSGAVGLALAAAVPGLELHATDVDPAAVRCARRNLVGMARGVYRGDLWEALPGALRGAVRLALCNAPYVPTGELDSLPPEAREHEPRRALDGGPDGVGLHRVVAAGAPRWLAPGGVLLVETARHRVGATVAALAARGLRTRVHVDDELGGTVVAGVHRDTENQKY